MIVEFDYNITITIWVDGQLDGVNLMIFVKNFLDRFYEMSGFWSGVCRDSGVDPMLKDKIVSAEYYAEKKQTRIVMETHPYMLDRPKRLYRMQSNFLQVSQIRAEEPALQDVSFCMGCDMEVKSSVVSGNLHPVENALFVKGQIYQVSMNTLGENAAYDDYIDLPNGYLLMSDVIVDNASIQKKMNSDDMAQAAGPGYDLIRYLKESGFTVE